MVALEIYEETFAGSDAGQQRPRAHVRDPNGRVLASIEDRTDFDDPRVRAAIEAELPTIVELVRFAAKHLVGVPHSRDPELEQRLALVRSYGIHCLEAVERVDRHRERSSAVTVAPVNDAMPD